MSKKKSKSAVNELVLSKNVSVNRTDKEPELHDVKWRTDWQDTEKFAELAGCQSGVVEYGFAEFDAKGQVTVIYSEQMDATTTKVTWVPAILCEEKKPINPEDVKPWTMAVKTEFDVPLTDAECTAYASEVCDLDAKIEQTQELLKEYASGERAQIKKLEGRKRTLTRAVNTKRETKRVECTQHFDPKTRTTWYEHRGEIQGRRPMDVTELKELQSRGGLFRDGIGGEPKAVSERLNGDELAKRVAQDAAIATQIKNDDAERQARKDSAPPKDGLSIVSRTADGTTTVKKVSAKTAQPAQ